MKQTAITPTREEDFPEWYQQVLKAADMAENSPVRGCMVIKPWGYGVWENIQAHLDKEFKRTGHQNAYFPLFIPLSFLQREAKHVEGFAKECAIVTHHRLEDIDGVLTPVGELEEPLIVRPTSETIIGDCFSRWIKSYRDLPVLINQWANVVRWEMRTRIFLRTTEFLWQEGHTAHETEEEALEETLKMLEIYRVCAEEILAIPVIVGEKSPGERFPGAVKTFTFEAMMQDRKALQGGTSHYLGQNFAKALDILFSDRDGSLQHPHMTSWGSTTRLVGAMIMVHGDDDGLRIPPRISPIHAVVIPVVPKPEMEAEVFAYAEKIQKELSHLDYHGRPLVAHLDKRDIRGGEKNWEWIKKGVPLRIEVGPRDMESGSLMLARRDQDHKAKEKISVAALPEMILGLLDTVQKNYFTQAQEHMKSHIREDIKDFEELKAFFKPKNEEKPEVHGGFVLAKWCGDPATEETLKEFKLTIRCLPLKQRETEGKCIITGKPATIDVIIAKSY